MAKGKSSIRQKQEYQRKKMYTPQQEMDYVRCKCDPKMIPIGGDEAAERRLKGGYKTDKTNRCAKHNMVRTKNGTCIECEADS